MEEIDCEGVGTTLNGSSGWVACTERAVPHLKNARSLREKLHSEAEPRLVWGLQRETVGV